MSHAALDSSTQYFGHKLSGPHMPGPGPTARRFAQNIGEGVGSLKCSGAWAMQLCKIAGARSLKGFVSSLLKRRPAHQYVTSKNEWQVDLQPEKNHVFNSALYFVLNNGLFYTLPLPIFQHRSSTSICSTQLSTSVHLSSAMATGSQDDENVTQELLELLTCHRSEP